MAGGRRQAWLLLACSMVGILGACATEETDDRAWRTLSDAGLRAVARGDEAEAEALLTAAVSDAETYGPGDFRLAITLNILAGFYRTVERYREAEPLYERALAIAEQRWGPDHPRVAMVLESYAILLGQTYRIDEAAAMAGRARAIRRAEG